MSISKPPICGQCDKEKTLLPNPTDRQGLPVFVCAQKAGRNKMPCDGFVPALSSPTL